jgi:hypothetical protein
MEGTPTTLIFQCKGCNTPFEQSYLRSRHEKKCIIIEAKNTCNHSLNSIEEKKDYSS